MYVLSAIIIAYLVTEDKLNTIYGEIQGKDTKKACREGGRLTVK